MAEVTINYKDAAIATMDASGTKTLQTQGKYCENDIEVVYSRPSGGGSTAAAGTVTLAENVQVPVAGQSKEFPGIVFSFQPDLFVITLDRSAWDTKSPPPATTFYTVWMIKKALTPPYRLSSDISTDSYAGDYLTFVSTNIIASSDVLSNAYALNGLNIVVQSHQPYWYIGTDGKFYFSRYSSSSTAGFTTGKYNYFGIKM